MRARATSTRPDDFARGTEAVYARAATLGVGETGRDMQAALRDAILQSGLPRKLANMVRLKSFPAKGDARDPAVLVFERPKKPGSEVADLLTVFSNSTVIVASSRRWLAIPTRAVEQGRYPEFGAKRHRVTPAIFEKSTGLVLRFVPKSSQMAFLVADSARVTRGGRATRAKGDWWKSGKPVICFILVPQVRLRQRFDWQAEEQRAYSALPGNIAKHFS